MPEIQSQVATQPRATNYDNIQAGKPDMESVPLPYVLREQLAKSLGITTRTLDRWNSEGFGPRRTKVGQRVLYRKDRVLEWLDHCDAQC